MNTDLPQLPSSELSLPNVGNNRRRFTPGFNLPNAPRTLSGVLGTRTVRPIRNPGNRVCSSCESGKKSKNCCGKVSA